MKKITIAWLYPNLMSIYGDYGNVLTLKKRIEWRGIKTEILEINFDNTIKLQKVDIILMGGGQDRQQAIVVQDMLNNKRKILQEAHQKGIPGLFACGGYQLLGHFYHPLCDDEFNEFNPANFEKKMSSFKFTPGKGADIPGLKIFPQYTIHYGNKKPRCIGNIVTEINNEFQTEINKISKPVTTLVGFENHGGRTYFLSGKDKNLGKVIKGWGNNGEDETEGIVSNNFLGTYLHGFLIKNPHVADFLISKALEIKYGETKIQPLDDSLEWQTHEKVKDLVLNKSKN